MFSNRKLVLIIILLSTLSISAYVLLVVIPARFAEQSYEGAKKIGRDIQEALQFTPEITVNNVVVLQQQTPILELATLSQQFEHKYSWTNTRFGSTKKITITGTFEAKAGYDLNKRFSVQIDQDKAVVILPPPELLSIEPAGDITFEDENGIFNWINQEDRSKATNAFISDARNYAVQAEFVNEARKKMEGQLTAILLRHSKTVEFRYEEPATIRPL